MLFGQVLYAADALPSVVSLKSRSVAKDKRNNDSALVKYKRNNDHTVSVLTLYTM